MLHRRTLLLGLGALLVPGAAFARDHLHQHRRERPQRRARGAGAGLHAGADRGRVEARAITHQRQRSGALETSALQEAIVERRPAEQSLLLRSGFNYDDRMKWNPSWQKPDSVVVMNDGSMLTWYLDGTDETVEELAAAHAS